MVVLDERGQTLHTRSDSDTHDYVASHLPAAFWFYKSGQKSANGYHCTLCEITHSCKFHPLIVSTVNFCSSSFFSFFGGGVKTMEASLVIRIVGILQ